MVGAGRADRRLAGRPGPPPDGLGAARGGRPAAGPGVRQHRGTADDPRRRSARGNRHPPRARRRAAAPRSPVADREPRARRPRRRARVDGGVLDARRVVGAHRRRAAARPDRANRRARPRGHRGRDRPLDAALRPDAGAAGRERGSGRLAPSVGADRHAGQPALERHPGVGPGRARDGAAGRVVSADGQLCAADARQSRVRRRRRAGRAAVAVGSRLPRVCAPGLLRQRVGAPLERARCRVRGGDRHQSVPPVGIRQRRHTRRPRRDGTAERLDAGRLAQRDARVLPDDEDPDRPRTRIHPRGSRRRAGRGGDLAEPGGPALARRRPDRPPLATGAVSAAAPAPSPAWSATSATSSWMRNRCRWSTCRTANCRSPA